MYHQAYPTNQIYGVNGFALPNDGDLNLVEVDYQKLKFNPNSSENACKEACDNSATCCLYIWDSNNDCCTLRSSGCYERNGLPSNDFSNMCTVDDSQSFPGVKSVAKNCKSWCDNAPAVPSCGGTATTCSVRVPRHLRSIVSQARLNKQVDITNSCKVNKPVIGAKKLAKKIYAQVVKTLRMPKRDSWTPAKRLAAQQRIYERFYQRFLQFNRSLGLKDVRLLDISIVAKGASNRRLLSGYDNIITYDISSNSSDEADAQEFLQIVVDYDIDYEGLGNDLLNDADFMENEDTFDVTELSEAADDEITLLEENEWDPTDPQWCQWQSTTI